MDVFYQKRANMVTEYITVLAFYFSSRYLIVGTDVYAPLAYYIG